LNLLKTNLDNGLPVLLRESRTAPVVTFWIWYRVGSRNEHLGITGISHWVEHMLFKGTERWPRRELDHSLARAGGFFNAMTWYDFTAYFETLPAHKFELALDIEADRMVNALFDPAEVEAERTVVISERQGKENSPTFLLDEEIISAAYRVHPYGHETIGYMCDLETMTRDDLYNHYRRYYTPRNATIAVAGDFNAGEMLRVIERAFGQIEPGPKLPALRAEEPPQRGERRVIVEGNAGTDYVGIAYHVPAAADADMFPLIILSVVLAGGSGSLVKSGGLTNHTSRLYRAVVARELAADIDATLIPTIDPSLYHLAATVLPDHTPAEVEGVILDEIDRMRQEKISDEELAKAKRQARALFAYSSESITNQGFWLGFSEIFANHAWFLTYLDRLDAVTADDVLRVAQTYLRAQNRTVGHYVSMTNEQM